MTTAADLQSIAQFIGGDKVTVDSLGRGTQDPHFLEAKPSYMMKAKKADLFIRVGLELEIGYEQLILDGSRNRRIQLGKPGQKLLSFRILLVGMTGRRTIFRLSTPSSIKSHRR